MSSTEEIAAAAAVWIVEHGLDFSAARMKALEHMGLRSARGISPPDNAAVEDAVREHLALFHADTQPEEQTVLRRLALQWMDRLADFDPHLGGAVWRGIATRHSPILIDLYADDPTAPEIALHNQGVRFETGEREGRRGEPVPVIGIEVRCAELAQHVPIEISVWPPEALHGALQRDARGLAWRGSRTAVAALLAPASPP